MFVMLKASTYVFQAACSVKFDSLLRGVKGVIGDRGPENHNSGPMDHGISQHAGIHRSQIFSLTNHPGFFCFIDLDKADCRIYYHYTLRGYGIISKEDP